MVRKIVLIAWVLAATMMAISANAQEYTRKQLNEDFQILRSSLNQGQGGVYRHTSEQNLNDLGSKLASSLVDGMTEIEFYRTL